MSRRASDWMFYLAPEAWERYKLLDMHDDLKQSQRDASFARARTGESLEAVEENLSRSLLLLHSLVEALVRKGLVSRDDISAVFEELDLRDGKADGMLAPGTVPGSAPQPPRSLSTEEYLKKLEAGNG